MYHQYMEEERYFTIAEIAAQLKVHQNTVRNWLYKRQLPGVRLGTGIRAGWRIRERDLSAFLQAPQYETGSDALS
jgi:excisionase family DNA binding protein